MMEEARKIFGIDLGTTYSCISYVDESGNPVVVKNMEGFSTTPSVVYFESESNVVVGQTAKDSAALFPNETVSFVKRSIGKPGFSHFYNGKDLSPEEVSSYILRKLVGDAEQQLGIEIKDVIISHPASFGINEKAATEKAGIIAGLNVVSLIDEPVAAAYSYGCANNDSDGSVILVYDLGGGTFDVTMIEVTSEQIKVICTGGNSNLGGKLWDDAIIQYWANQFEEQTGVPADNLLDDPEMMQELMLKSEYAKKQLTQKDKYMAPLSFDGNKPRIEITREKFEELTEALLGQTITYTHETLKEAKAKGYDHFDKLLLVGGSTLMPQVTEAIKREFGVDPQVFDPHESVSKGAALLGYAESNRQFIRKIVQEMVDNGIIDNADNVIGSDGNVNMDTLDEVKKAIVQQAAAENNVNLFTLGNGAKKPVIVPVTSKSFGIIANDSDHVETLFNLILKNTNIPCDVAQRFFTDEANQASVLIRICESEVSDSKTQVEMGVLIGEAIFDIPARLPALSPIDVSFTLNAEGLLKITAVETTEGRECRVQIQVTNGLSEEQVNEAISASTGITVQ